MSGIVIIDAGIAVKAVLPNAIQASCRALLGGLTTGGLELAAPALWAYETTSTLTKAVHFKQLTAEEGHQALLRIQALDVRLIPPDPDQGRKALEWTMKLRRAAAYDSFYLALAESHQCVFWTADERLANAVDVPWVRSVSRQPSATTQSGQPPASIGRL